MGYVDFGALRSSAVGQQLIEAAVKAEAAKGLPIQVDVPKVLATIGSSLGTLLTAFYLVLLFEVNTILIFSICVSVALGGLAMAANWKGKIT